MKKEDIITMIGEVYVGYNPNYTADTALATATSKINSHLGTHYSFNEAKELMKDYNIIGCGGLDNYLVKLYLKMREGSLNVSEPITKKEVA